MEKKFEENKNVIISGGSRGLGLASSEYLLERGYKVSSFGRTETDEVQQLKERFTNNYYYQKADISISEDMRSFVKNAMSENGKIYALINNAAVAQDGVLATLPEVEITKMMMINLEAAIKLTRLCVRQMLTQMGGRIINISSIIGSRAYNGLAVYSATKAGLDGFTRAMSRELGRREITVNSIGPGYMKTDMSAGLNDGRLNQIIKRTPLQRLANIDDITPAIEFLLSDGAKFITGQTILIDGGISA